MKNRKFAVVALLAVFLAGCNSGEQNKNQKALPVAEVQETKEDKEVISEQLPDVAANFDFLKNVPVRSLPYHDSTNFDNYKGGIALTDEQSRALGFNPPEMSSVDTDINVNYRLDLSDKFHAYVFSYHKGEMELFTSLCIYGPAYERIGQLIIAYDEVAESWSRVESIISDEKITVKGYTYYDEDPQINVNVYSVNKENGELVEIESTSTGVN